MTFKKLVTPAALFFFGGLTLSADVHVGSAEAMKAAITKPAPAYSAIARQMKVGGHVEVEAIVSPDGSVEAVKATVGNPLLTQSAVQAVQKWRFTPFTANGEPTRAVVVLGFDFRP
jgi:periplasmic protein TonB